VENIGAGTDASVDVYLCVFDNDTTCPPTQKANTSAVTPGSFWDSQNGPSILSNKSYYLYVVNKGGGRDAYIRIKTYGLDPSTGVNGPLGFPLVAKQAVLVQSSLGGLTRRYKAVVPQ
jgi:hypothetical protein